MPALTFTEAFDPPASRRRSGRYSSPIARVAAEARRTQSGRLDPTEESTLSNRAFGRFNLPDPNAPIPGVANVPTLGATRRQYWRPQRPLVADLMPGTGIADYAGALQGGEAPTLGESLGAAADLTLLPFDVIGLDNLVKWAGRGLRGQPGFRSLAEGPVGQTVSRLANLTFDEAFSPSVTRLGEGLPRRAGEAGVFINPLRDPKATGKKTLARMRAADKMADLGADDAQIWEKTGLWRISDDEPWVSEISDHAMTFKPTKAKRLRTDKVGNLDYHVYRMGDIVDHPDLYKAYPDLEDVEVRINANPSEGVSASYSPGTDTIDIHAFVDRPGQKRMIAHEIQHGIQQREGWAQGGSVKEFTSDPSIINARARVGSYFAHDEEMGYFGSAKERKASKAQAKRVQDFIEEMPLRERGVPVSTDELYRLGGAEADELRLGQIENQLRYAVRRAGEEGKPLKDVETGAIIDEGVLDSILRSIRNDPVSAYDKYRHLLGEAMASVTEASQLMTPAQRANIAPSTRFGMRVQDPKAISPEKHSPNINPEKLDRYSNYLPSERRAQRRAAGQTIVDEPGRYYAQPDDLTDKGDYDLVSEARRPPTGRSILMETRKNEGATVNPVTGVRPVTGYMVGQSKKDPVPGTLPSGRRMPELRGVEVMVPGPKMTGREMDRYIEANRARFENPEKFLGTWINPENQQMYLDISKRFEPQPMAGRGREWDRGFRKAVREGDRRFQEAIFDLGTFDTLPVQRWDDFVDDPRFISERVMPLFERGRRVEEEMGGKLDWWDMHGTLFERLWPHDLDRVAGFSAATSPNTDQFDNIKQMTEYMRRYRSGEPIIQPAPFSGAPPMPMEQTRRQMLERVMQGLPLRSQKVGGMERALMGDPDVAVMDRHHAKYFQDAPNFAGRGHSILDPDPSIFPAGVRYTKGEETLRQAARAAGVPLDEFSATIWVGIRDMLAKGEPIFGMQFPKGASMSANDSYAGLLQRAVNETAQRLDTSPQKIAEEVSKGNMNLMSALLATPTMATLLGATLSTGDNGGST